MPFVSNIQLVRQIRRAGAAFALGLAALTTACSTPSHAVPSASTPAVPASPQNGTASSAGPVAQTPEDAKFYAFLHDFRSKAIANGIRPEVYDQATANIKRNDRVMQLNGDQPEFVKQVWQYLDTAVSDKRISDGLNAMNANLNALFSIEQRYGVPKEILVSVWGNETDFGAAMGSFNMFEALATLGYDGPRADYARPQLLAALHMVQDEHFSPLEMTCSWAGAFGHTQLIPTEFLAHAVDGDGDGKRDMWHSAPDALASTANLLVEYGWKRNEPSYVEVKLPPGFAYELADGDTQHFISEWTKLGVTRVGGTALSAYPDHGAIYLPAGARGPAFLLYDNFRSILKYNNAASYALAISYLANRLHGGSAIAATWPRDERALTKDERVQFQTALKTLGYDVGKIDGVLGRGTKAQLRLYQKARGLPADGFPTAFLLSRMTAETAPKKS